jgi:peptidoglycan/LPS O-acetylase OafA/YrhL
VIHSTFETPSHVQPVNLGNPALEPPKKRLRNIDALRGVCAILVVLAHIVPETWLGARIWTSDPLFYLDFGRIGVAAFFLISGYVIPFSIPNAGQRVTQFWIARFFRLWPAYWVCILLTLSIGSSEIPPKLTNVALNFTMFQKFFGIQDMVGVFWTLQIELVFYVMASSSLIMSALRGILHVRLPVALPMALTLMFLAAYIRSCRLMAKPIPGIMIVSYIVTLIPICLLGYSTNLSGADDPYRWMLAYLIGLLIFLLFESFADAPSVAVFMGTISYSVYLLHQALIKASRSLFGSKNIIADTAFVLTFTIAASWIVYRLVEIPSQRLGKTLIKRIQAAAL